MNWNRKAASLTASTLAVLAAGGGIAFALADTGSGAPHTPGPATSSPADALATGDTPSSTQPPATDLPSSDTAASTAATTSAAASTAPAGASAVVPSTSAMWTPTKVPQSTGGYVTVSAQPASSTAGVPAVQNPKYTPSSWSGPGLTSVPTPSATSSG